MAASSLTQSSNTYVNISFTIKLLSHSTTISSTNKCSMSLEKKNLSAGLFFFLIIGCKDLFSLKYENLWMLSNSSGESCWNIKNIVFNCDYVHVYSMALKLNIRIYFSTWMIFMCTRQLDMLLRNTSKFKITYIILNIQDNLHHQWLTKSHASCEDSQAQPLVQSLHPY